jgi:hypothetical protein
LQIFTIKVFLFLGGVLELADRHDLGSCAARRAGSSPAFPTYVKSSFVGRGISDELGFIPFSIASAQLMFQFCSTFHERIALIVTTNLKFAGWTQPFGGEQLIGDLWIG